MSPYRGGDERVRTDDPLLAKQVLSQLSYTPMPDLYIFEVSFSCFFKLLNEPSKLNSRLILPRKEVIQPLVLERLPCYDFTPVIGFALGKLFTVQLWAPPTSVV